jgi:hypothetical protein
MVLFSLKVIIYFNVSIFNLVHFNEYIFSVVCMPIAIASSGIRTRIGLKEVLAILISKKESTEKDLTPLYTILSLLVLNAVTLKYRLKVRHI